MASGPMAAVRAELPTPVIHYAEFADILRRQRYDGQIAAFDRKSEMLTSSARAD